MPSAIVPETAKQADDTRDPRQWGWVEPTVWSERMLAALVNGVTGGKWYSLWDKVSDRRTLEASWRAVARNQGAAGVDGQSVQRFAAQAERYLDELAAGLQAGRYQPNDVRRTYIPKAGGGQRPLGIPTQVYIMFAIVILADLLVRRTSFGQYVLSIGGNERAARFAVGSL